MSNNFILFSGAGTRSMKDIIVIANWKMNSTARDANSFFRSFIPRLAEIQGLASKRIVVCPPFTALHACHRAISSTRLQLGAQDMYFEDKGAFTGEISAEMLKESGVKFVLAGHSERRHILGETDETINKKVLAILKNSMVPVLCVGEKLEEREKGLAKKIVGDQLKGCLKGITNDSLPKVIVAYEPVWAIGTGKNATSNEAEEMHSFIRNSLVKMFSKQSGNKVYILYGGSVNRGNAAEFSKMPNINGLLVGGASLDAGHFAEIISLA